MIRYNCVLASYFLKRSKRLLKKYPSLKKDILNCLSSFDKRCAFSLGENIYKLRLKSSDLKRGKGKSFRLVILLMELDSLIVPLQIYYKGDVDSITLEEIHVHLECILEEINDGL